ncbi:hypothetical protein B0O99DRAFT_627565 [Bisporella sp. PMI_857]|nr:hypothetical protein B0O99DRAFT_627565 [Bisporella sp. PMI_857]
MPYSYCIIYRSRPFPTKGAFARGSSSGQSRVGSIRNERNFVSCGLDHQPGTNNYCTLLQRRTISISSRSNREPQIIMERSNRHISLRGQFLDHVVELGSVIELLNMTVGMHDALSISQDLGPIFRWVEDAQELARKHVHDPYHNQQMLSEEFWRTLIGDRNLERRPTQPVMENTSKSFKNRFELWETPTKKLIMSRDIQSSLRMLQSNFPPRRACSDFCET